MARSGSLSERFQIWYVQIDLSRREIMLATITLIFVISVGMIDQSKGNRMRFNPDPSAEIQEGDILIALGDPDMIRTLGKKGCTPVS